MTLLMLSWTRTARAMAEGERGSSLCWLVDDPSPLLRQAWGGGEREGKEKKKNRYEVGREKTEDRSKREKRRRTDMR